MASGLDPDDTTVSDDLGGGSSPISDVLRAIGGTRVYDPDEGTTDQNVQPFPGEQIGRYLLLDKLASGAVGVVFAAQDLDLDRVVALKVLDPDHVNKQAVVRRFVQEARAIARISHPGVVTVLDAGEYDGGAYIAMDLLEGESLIELLAKHQRLLPNDAVEIARQLAAALEAAHAAGVLHRDLTPENIILVHDPSMPGGRRAIVLDFGLAKLFEAPRRTALHVVFGTPHYMSPEQCLSSTNVDHRSDIYSLGCILFELVTGSPPYNGEIDQIIEAHLDAEIPRASHLAPCSAQLEDVLDKLLAKNPEQRLQSMTDVRAALDALPYKRLGSQPSISSGRQQSPPAGGVLQLPRVKDVPPPRVVARGTAPPPSLPPPFPRSESPAIGRAPTPVAPRARVDAHAPTPHAPLPLAPTPPSFPRIDARAPTPPAFPRLTPTPPKAASGPRAVIPTPVTMPPPVKLPPPRAPSQSEANGVRVRQSTGRARTHGVPPSGPVSVSTAMAMSMAIAPMPKAPALKHVMAVPVGLPAPRRKPPEINLEPDSRLPIILIAIACILSGAITAMFVA